MSTREQILRSVLDVMPPAIGQQVGHALGEPDWQYSPPLSEAELLELRGNPQAPVDEAQARTLVSLVARIGAVACTVVLRTPPESGPAIGPAGLDPRIALMLRAGPRVDHPFPVPEDDPAAQWLSYATFWRTIGDARNTVMALACAILLTRPGTPWIGRPLPDVGIDHLQLAIGAAGGYALPETVQPALARSVRDNYAGVHAPGGGIRI